MAAEELFITQNTNPTGWIPDFFDYNSLTEAAGRQILLTPQLNEKAAYWTSKGPVALLVNAGSEGSLPGGSGVFGPGGSNPLDVSRRWVLQGKGYIWDSIGNKHLSTWQYDGNSRSSTDVEAVTDYWFRAREIGMLTGDAGEGGPLVYGDNPTIFNLHEKRMGEKADARGQLYFGQYAGGVAPFGNNSLAVDALISDAGAATWARKRIEEGGGRSNLVPYFSDEHYNYYHLTVNGYYLGANNTFDRMYSAMGQRVAARRALRATGVNRKILYYTEATENEVGAGNQGGEGQLYGYTARYKRSLGAGKGYVIGYGWPPVPFGYLLFDYFHALFLCDKVNYFMPNQCWGRNTDVLKPFPELRDYDKFNLYDYSANGTGFQPQTAQPLLFENADPNKPSAFPDRPLGHLNALPEAYRLFAFCTARAGSINYGYPSVKIDDTIYQPVSNSGDQFLNTCYNSGLPLCFYGVNEATGEGWVAAYWVDNRDGSAKTGYLDVTFICGNTSVPMRLLSSIPRFFKF